MTRTLPAQALGWIPDNTTNILDPGSRKTAGYTPLTAPAAQEHNWIFNVVSQHINYMRNMVNVTKYCDLSGGSDTTGDGTILAPYANIDRALNDLAPGSAAVIYLKNDTASSDVQYTIAADHDLYNQSILFDKYGTNSGNNCIVQHSTYVSSNFNYIRALNLHNSIVSANTSIKHQTAVPYGLYSWAVNATPFKADYGDNFLYWLGNIDHGTGLTVGGNHYLFLSSSGIGQINLSPDFP